MSVVITDLQSGQQRLYQVYTEVKVERNFEVTDKPSSSGLSLNFVRRRTPVKVSVGITISTGEVNSVRSLEGRRVSVDSRSIPTGGVVGIVEKVSIMDDGKWDNGSSGSLTASIMVKETFEFSVGGVGGSAGFGTISIPTSGSNSVPGSGGGPCVPVAALTYSMDDIVKQQATLETTLVDQYKQSAIDLASQFLSTLNEEQLRDAAKGFTANSKLSKAEYLAKIFLNVDGGGARTVDLGGTRTLIPAGSAASLRQVRGAGSQRLTQAEIDEVAAVVQAGIDKLAEQRQSDNEAQAAGLLPEPLNVYRKPVVAPPIRQLGEGTGDNFTIDPGAISRGFGQAPPSPPPPPPNAIAPVEGFESGVVIATRQQFIAYFDAVFKDNPEFGVCKS